MLTVAMVRADKGAVSSSAATRANACPKQSAIASDGRAARSKAGEFRSVRSSGSVAEGVLLACWPAEFASNKLLRRGIFALAAVEQPKMKHQRARVIVAIKSASFGDRVGDRRGAPARWKRKNCFFGFLVLGPSLKLRSRRGGFVSVSRVEKIISFGPV